MTFDDGRKCYIAYRKQEEIFRHGCSSISEAIRDGKAAWAFDIDTILEMRAKGIKAMGVIVRETGDIWMTKIEWLTDSTKAKVLNYSARGGALQRYLPLRFFWRKRGKLILKPA
ncbi:hypothetical protein [Magnetospirillum molischianum]|uniref:hypothetical protein n=1 Tax=Magnetospirillum molischianum TaxID=1083 RepID=UPI0012DE48FB|nr:hypothetical protein [Magnetospirillum molischianum]